MKIYESKNFIVESHERPEIDREEGGHIKISPKRKIIDRTKLSPAEAVELMRLTVICGKAMKKAILIHGFGGRGNQGWFGETKKFLESENYIVYNPDFPKTDKPTYKEWKIFFEKKLLSMVDNNTFFVAHSLGPTFLIKYLSENDLNIEIVVFVAPAVRKNPDFPELDNFFENFDLLKVKKSIKNIYVLYSNDPYIPQEDFEYLISELDAKGIYMENKEHFTQNEDFNPDILKILKDIINKV